MKTIIPFMCNIMHVDLTDYQLTKEDKERIHLLSIVEKKGLKPLNLENLRLLERLVDHPKRNQKHLDLWKRQRIAHENAFMRSSIRDASA